MRRTGLLAALLLIATSCRRSAPDAPPPGQGPLPPLEILKGGRWLFTYVEPSGTFATTDKPEVVPEGGRHVVRVIDPTRPASERVDSAQVYVADLTDLLKSGKTQARPLAREAFETGAIAQLPAGESSPMGQPGGAGQPAPQPPPLPPQPQPPHPAASGTQPGNGGAPVVIVYGTSWCGACRSARQYLTERKIPFADKDVERDPAAARELSEKASRMGIPTDRVPILDVRGRLLIGFDRARVEALLGAPT